MRRRLKETAWLRLGIVRDGDGVRTGLREVRRLVEELGSRSPASPRALLAHSELASSLLTAEACFTAALHRRESRGAHFRSDFPDQDPSWARPTVLGLGPDGPVLEDAPFLEAAPAPRAGGARPSPPHQEVSDDA